MSINTLSHILECNKEVVKKACQFWQFSKILTLFGDMAVSNDFGEIEKYQQVESDTDMEYADAEKENSSTKDIDMIWPFLQGMLQNLGSLEAVRIHQTLLMFKSDIFDYNMKPHELNIVLETLVIKERLEFDEGKFKLKKK